jgi:hypothetical protein
LTLFAGSEAGKKRYDPGDHLAWHPRFSGIHTPHGFGEEGCDGFFFEITLGTVREGI